MPNIRPSSELRNNYTNIMKLCREQNQPVFLTVNGKKLAMLLDEAEKEINTGNYYTQEEVFAELDKKIELLKKRAQE